MTQYPLYKRLGGPQSLSGQVGTIPPPPGFNPQTVHSIASPYINYAILAQVKTQTMLVFTRTENLMQFLLRYSVDSSSSSSPVTSWKHVKVAQDKNFEDTMYLGTRS
jgi:hypothetical protein